MDYIFKPMSYVLVIMLGYLLKRAGFFGKDDHRLMSKIMVNITCRVPSFRRLTALNATRRCSSSWASALSARLCRFC